MLWVDVPSSARRHVQVQLRQAPHSTGEAPPARRQRPVGPVGLVQRGGEAPTGRARCTAQVASPKSQSEHDGNFIFILQVVKYIACI